MPLKFSFREYAGAALIVAGVTGAAAMSYSANQVTFAQSVSQVPEAKQADLIKVIESRHMRNAIAAGAYERSNENDQQFTAIFNIHRPTANDIVTEYNNGQASMRDARYEFARILAVLFAFPGVMMVASGRRTRNREGMPLSHKPA